MPVWFCGRCADFVAFFSPLRWVIVSSNAFLGILKHSVGPCFAILCPFRDFLHMAGEHQMFALFRMGVFHWDMSLWFPEMCLEEFRLQTSLMDFRNLGSSNVCGSYDGRSPDVVSAVLLVVVADSLV